MILGYVTTLQIEELERTGKATITEAPAEEGVVSFPLVFKAEADEQIGVYAREFNRISERCRHFENELMKLRAETAPWRADAAPSRARAHLPRIDRDALGLSLMTDEQAFASYERFGQVQRMYANLVMAGDRT